MPRAFCYSNAPNALAVAKSSRRQLQTETTTGAAGVVSTNERAETEFRVVLTMMGEPDPWGEPIKCFPYADLRQMATELLASSELLALTE